MEMDVRAGTWNDYEETKPIKSNKGIEVKENHYSRHLKRKRYIEDEEINLLIFVLTSIFFSRYLFICVNIIPLSFPSVFYPFFIIYTRKFFSLSAISSILPSTLSEIFRSIFSFLIL